MKFKRQKLFNDEYLKNPNFVTPYEKSKWTKKFTNWCNEMYYKYGSQNGLFCCSYMKICDECDLKYLQGCRDCVEQIKQWYKKHNKEIPYRNYDFKKIFNEVEKRE